MNEIYVLALIIAQAWVPVLELSFKSCDAPMKCFWYEDADCKSVLVAVEECDKYSTLET